MWLVGAPQTLSMVACFVPDVDTEHAFGLAESRSRSSVYEGAG
jgi:hypothetical protein